MEFESSPSKRVFIFDQIFKVMFYNMDFKNIEIIRYIINILEYSTAI